MRINCAPSEQQVNYNLPLPNELLRACDYISTTCNTDQGFVLASLISSIAVAMRGVCVVTPNELHTEHVTMSTILVAESSVGKGRALDAPLGFIRNLQQEIQYRANNHEHIQNYEKGDSSLPILTISGCTPQKLLKILTEQSGFISIIDEELSTVRRLIQYPDFSDWTLKLLEGDSIESATLRGDHLRVDNAQAIILTATQPDTLSQIVTRYKLYSNGFLSRSFIVVPDFFKFQSNSLVTIASYYNFEFKLRGILNKTSKEDGSKRETEIRITLSPQAQARLDQMHFNLRNYHPSMVSSETNAVMRSWSARAYGHTLKIAAILLAYQYQLSTTEIDEETMIAAISVTSWLENCMFHSCCELLPAPGLKGAMAIASALRKVNGGAISKSDLHELAARGLNRQRDFVQGVSLLLDIGVIEQGTQPLPYGSKGGRPRKVYIIHHEALERFFPRFGPPNITW